MSLTSMLFRAARMSAEGRAVRRGPEALMKREARKQVAREIARTGLWRWPK